MSISSVRPFFRTRLEGLGFDEHTDAVDFENVPSTILDNTFQLFTDAISGAPANQLAHDFDYSLTLRIFKRGFRDPVEAHDTVDQDIETILSDLLNPDVRLGTAIKDIVPVAINKNPLSASDDNDVLLEFNFSVRIIICFA